MCSTSAGSRFVKLSGERTHRVTVGIRISRHHSSTSRAFVTPRSWPNRTSPSPASRA
jgi:hypothetical protein